MEEKRKKTPKQIAALLCVVLLVCLYLLTFLFACLDFEGSDKLFSACLLATVGLPFLCWIFIWFSGILHKRREENLQQFETKEPQTKETDGNA